MTTTAAPAAAFDRDADLAPTRSLQLLLTAAPIVLSSGGIVACDGVPGVGKTTAVTQLIARHAGDSEFVSLEPRSTDKNVIEQVYRRFVPPDTDTTGTRRAEMQFRLRYLLASATDLVVIDEAQNAGLAALEMIRHLHEQPTSHWGLVLSGVGLEKKLAKEPMLADRVDLRIPFTPLTGDDLYSALSAMQPVLAAIPHTLVDAVDAKFCRGILRPWVKVMRWLIQFGCTADQPPTKEQLEQALLLVSGRQIRL